MASQRIDVTAIQETVVEHLGQPPETLRPNQGNILIRKAVLAARICLFRFDA